MKKHKYSFNPIHGFRQMNGEESFNGINFEKMPPFLRTLLVTDGTVTRILEAYLWESISVNKIDQEEIILDKDLSFMNLKIGEKVLKREVLLKGVDSGYAYTFAESFIQLDSLNKDIRKELEKGIIGIGELLRDKRLETYRELIDYGKIKAGEFSNYFDIEPDSYIYFRTYIIFSGGKPIIMITENFSEDVFIKIQESGPSI